MGLLDELTNGGQAQQDYQDFVRRYDQGAPHENISPGEAQQSHDQVSQNLSPDDYGQAAETRSATCPTTTGPTLASSSPTRPKARGVGGDQLAGAQQGDPSSMGQLAGLLHGQSPGIVGELHGDGGQAGTGALAGIVADAARKLI